MQELADAPSGDPKLAELHRFLGDSDFDQLENAWMDLVAGESALTGEQIDSLSDAARALMRQGFTTRAGPLVELLAPAAERAAGASPRSLLRVSELLVRAFPQNRDYLAALVDRFHGTFGPTTAERAYFDAAGVADSGDPAAALARFDLLMRFQPGTVVYHASGWGMGEVLSVDPLLAQVRVDLDEKKDHRIAIAAVDSILEALPESSFRAQIYRGAGELRRLVAEDPVALVESVMADFGNPLAQKDIKQQLVPVVLDAKSWTKWWGQAKQALRASGYFRVGDRSPYAVEKLETELTFENDLLERFRRSGDAADRRLAARQVLKGGPETFPLAFVEVGTVLCDEARTEDTAERAIDSAYLAERHSAGENAGLLLRETLLRFSLEQVAEALATRPAADEVVGLVAAIKAARPDDWEQIFRSVFLGKSDAPRAAIAGLLETEAPDWIRALGAETCASPRLSPDACCWLLERRLKDEKLACVASLTTRRQRGLFLLMMDLLEHLADREVREGRAAVRDLYRRVEGLMYWGKGTFFREAVLAMDTPYRVQVHRGLVRNQENLQKVATKLLEILGLIEPRIALADEIPPWKDERVILTTAAGLDRRREELRELREEKLPAIFKAIGDAAAFGDLSENAEFTSALEERDNLVKKAEQVQADLEKALVIDSTVAKPGVVGVGSRVRVRSLADGRDVEYRVLGPWDGSPEDGVLNYRSPLGQSFLERGDGEEVDVVLPSGTSRYLIVSSTPIGG